MPKVKDEWHNSCSGKEVDGPALQFDEPVRIGLASSRRSESSSDEAPLIEKKVKVRVVKLGKVPEGGSFKIGAHGRCKMINGKIYKLQESGDLGAAIGYKTGFGKQKFKKNRQKKYEPAKSGASQRDGGEHGEAGAPESGRGGAAHRDRIEGPFEKRQRTLRQMFLPGASGHDGQAGASEHGER